MLGKIFGNLMDNLHPEKEDSGRHTATATVRVWGGS